MKENKLNINRRNFIKKVVYAAPVMITLGALEASAAASGSGIIVKESGNEVPVDVIKLPPNFF